MKILILGGSGYLASCLCYYLKKKNEITLGTRDVRKIDNNHQNIKIKKINYLSYKSLNQACKNKDIIFHLVGANNKFSKSNKNKSLELKKKITQFLLSIAKKNNTKIIYFSSSQVYKYININNINENSIVKKSNSYTKNHLVAEKLILNHNTKNKTKHLIIRSSSIFGMPYYIKSAETFNLIINSMCQQAIKKQSIKINDVSTIRNFVPSRIFINFKKFILDTQNYGIINFGYKTMYLLDVAKIIKKICKHQFNTNIKLITNKTVKKKKIPTFKSLFIKKKIQNRNFYFEIKRLLKIIKINEKK